MALANTAEIMAAYDAVLANELDWYVVKDPALFIGVLSDFDRFLLHYPNVTVRIVVSCLVTGWILISLPQAAADELALYAFGSSGLEELKTKIDTSDIEQVLVGLVRVDDIAIPGAEEETEEELVKYVLISYVPRGVLGVRRGERVWYLHDLLVLKIWIFSLSLARAKVHSRRLGMIFKVSFTSLIIVVWRGVIVEVYMGA